MCDLTRVRGFWFWVVLLLVAFAGRSLWQGARTSATWDEPQHLGAGVSYWRWGDHRVSTYNFVVAQKLVALPVLAIRADFPDAATAPRDPTQLGRQFLYDRGNDPVQILRAGRAAVTTAGLALALFTSCWARRIFGERGALIALVVLLFDPTFLAHSSLVTVDVVAALFLFTTVAAGARVLERCALPRIVLLGALLALSLATKYSVVIVVATLATLAVVRLASGRPLAVALPGNRQREITGVLPQAGWVVGAFAAAVMVAWAGVWAIYGFRFHEPGIEFPWEQAGPGTLVYRGAILLRSLHLFPEPFIFDLTGFKSLVIPRTAFVAGAYHATGVPRYFPLMFLFKTPPAVLAASAAAVVAAVFAWRTGDAALRSRLRAATPVAIFAGIYFASACAGKLNIGHRHLLPFYPALAVLLGALTLLPWRRTLGAIATAVGSVGLLATAVTADRPLSYYNLFAGGVAAGHRWAVDSSYDWGAELPDLREWLQLHAREELAAGSVHLAYFGTARPAASGVDVRLLESMEVPTAANAPTWKTGLYIFSAHVLQTGVSGLFGPWTLERERALKDLRAKLAATQPERRTTLESAVTRLATARLAAWLRTTQRTADARPAQVYFAFRLNDDDLERALTRDPAPISPVAYK